VLRRVLHLGQVLRAARREVLAQLDLLLELVRP
jgi:hypothetical protein